MVDALRVLVVDDDEADRLLFRRALGRSGLGVIVEEAGYVGEALVRLAAEPAVDCVLVDLHLPDGSPEPILRMPGRRFAVVVVTGLDRASFSSLAVLEEADGALAKDDASAATVGAAVQNALASRSART